VAPFRIIVEDGSSTSAFVISLERTPDIGQKIELPHGTQVVVRQVTTASGGLAGTVLAGPSN
jgi:hypothetical protein